MLVDLTGRMMSIYGSFSSFDIKTQQQGIEIAHQAFQLYEIISIPSL